MPKGKIPSTYIYKPTDSVESLATANGITPQALINANPGGYPFSTGQNILLPGPVLGQPNPGASNPNSIYNAGTQTSAAQPAVGVANTISGMPQQSLLDQWKQKGTTTTGGGGFTQPAPWSQAWVTSQWHQARENQSMGTFSGVSNTANFLTSYLASDRLPPSLTSQQVLELKNSGMDVSGFAAYYDIGADGKLTLNEAGKEAAKAAASSTGAPAGNSDFMNTRFMQQNVEQGVSFYNQLRWDPDRKKYVKIGDLMRQGKLDPSGRWNSRGNKKGGRGGSRRPRPAAANEDAVQVSNDFVNFSVSSG